VAWNTVENRIAAKAVFVETVRATKQIKNLTGVFSAERPGRIT
jgi:hypothetical protein